MLAVSTPLCDRLAALPALAGWDVRSGIEHSNRAVLPAVDVRCEGAKVSGSRTGLLLSPFWRITLAIKRSSSAAAVLDAALTAVIGSLHNWPPGEHGGRNWEPLVLVHVIPPELQDASDIGYELMFTTGATYSGQP